MRTVLVTGGSRGIGAALVRRFAREGHLVAFIYHQSHAAAAALVKETGAISICADIGDEKQAVSAVGEALRQLGHIDVLINNAGISSFRLFTDITGEEWNRMLAVNLSGAFYCAREVLRDMLQRHDGCIMQITSMWGQVGSSCEVHYSATKAALIGMTRALAKEVGPSGIRVNAIAPGVIDTDINRALGEESIAALQEETPLGRIGTPEDVANCAWFLAGEGGAFITGQVFGVNGGFVI